MKAFRTTKARDEISKVMSSNLDLSSSFIIWQKAESGQRVFKNQTRISFIDHENGFFRITLNKETCHQADLSKEFYFLREDNNFVFKTKLSLDQVQGEIRFQIPKSANLLEMRKHPRTYFKPEEKRHAEITFFSAPGTREPQVKVACPIINISKGGICIALDKETWKNIDLTKVIHVEGVSFFEDLSAKIIGVPKHTRVIKKSHLKMDDGLALGIQFLFA
jgi:hypothetical protein